VIVRLEQSLIVLTEQDNLIREIFLSDTIYFIKKKEPLTMA